MIPSPCIILHTSPPTSPLYYFHRHILYYKHHHLLHHILYIAINYFICYMLYYIHHRLLHHILYITIILLPSSYIILHNIKSSNNIYIFREKICLKYSYFIITNNTVCDKFVSVICVCMCINSISCIICKNKFQAVNSGHSPGHKFLHLQFTQQHYTSICITLGGKYMEYEQ